MSDPKTILFVDDDKDFLESQSIYFSSRGYRVLTAESGADALKLLATVVPDIVILDLMMEHFDSGFVLSRKIRQDDRFNGMPIVMLSGVAAATGRRFDQEGDSLKKWSRLDCFLDKPLTGKQLLKVIEEKTAAAL